MNKADLNDSIWNMSNDSAFNDSYSTFRPDLSSSEEIDDDGFEKVDRLFRIVVPIVFGLVVVIGLFGNALVVIVVSCNQQMRNTTNLLIINLAVADLLFIVFCVPFTAIDYALPYWLFGETWCQIVQFFVFVCAYASVYTLVLMSLDRYLAVVHPIDSRRFRNDTNTLLAIVIMWIVILLACIPALLAHGLHEYSHQNQSQVACTFLSDENNYPAFQTSFFLFSYVIPLALICGLYLVMLKRLWHGVGAGARSSEEHRRKKRATRLVVVVVFIFAVCWCPIQVVLLLRSQDSYAVTVCNVVIQIVSQILAYMNSCINPILYAFLSENFRKAFHKVIACRSDPPKVYRSYTSKKNAQKTINKSVRYDNNDTETTNAMV